MLPFYVIGNLKMHLVSRNECDHYLTQLRREVTGKKFRVTRGVIAPPAIHLSYCAHLPEAFALGAQNMGWEKAGAFTGEISPLMLRDAGVEYCILGHSERRLYAGETDELVARKVRLALKERLVPIVCVGETQAERDSDRTTDIIEHSVRTIFDGLTGSQAEKIILAYEPRWAIGSGLTPTTADILQIKIVLRKLFSELFSPVVAERIPVVYGGSVKAAFLPAVSWEAEMSGVLVGGESLFPRELVKMMVAAEEHFRSAS
jgi:triosephosphate isomerase (TIM)